ncbi:MAG TPA: hypothetical protein VFU56_07085 [Gaiellaceae bacterium]|nr:hypothetical protein [Gaiellaceae bacterium]
MRKQTNVVLAVLVLAAAGFAGASIVGGGFAAILDDTISTSSLSTSTATATTPLGRRVVICHLTHSKKHPSHTITVSQHALRAHLKHGDTLGACVQGAEAHGKKGHGKGNAKHDATTTGASKPEHDAGHGHGAGHGKGK